MMVIIISACIITFTTTNAASSTELGPTSDGAYPVSNTMGFTPEIEGYQELSSTNPSIQESTTQEEEESTTQEESTTAEPTTQESTIITTEEVTTPIPVLPEPENITLSDATNSSIMVKWDYDNENPSLLDFTVNCFCIDVHGTEECQNHTGSADNTNTTYQCIGLTAGALYTACVKANHEQEGGMDTTCVHESQEIITIPNKPENLTMLSNGIDAIEIEWDYPQTGGYTNFIVTVGRITVVTSPPYSYTGADSSTEYSFEVKTQVNYTGEEELSFPETGKFWTVPEKVRALTTSPSESSSEVTWNAPVNNGGIDLYVVNVYHSSVCHQSLYVEIDTKENDITGNCEDATKTTNNGNNTEISINITNLDPCSGYEIDVIAINAGGNSTPEFENIQTEVTVPEPVDNLQVEDVSAYSVNLSWNLLGCDRNNAVMRYDVLYKYTDPLNGDKESDVQNHSIATSDRNITTDITNLLPYKNYTFVVFAINEKGTSDAKTTSETTLEAEPSSRVKVTLNTRNSSSITITWEPPVEANGVILYYSIEMEFESQDPGGGTELVKENVTENETTKTFNNLYAYWDYTFTVEAYNSIGPGDSKSKEESDRTDEAAPGEVEDIKVHNVQDKCYLLNVTWQSPTKQNQNGIVRGYKIWEKSKGDIYNCKTEEGNSSHGQLCKCVDENCQLNPYIFTHRDLDPNNESYSYKVRAVTIDDGKESPKQGTTGVCAPEIPPNGGVNASEPGSTLNIDTTKSFAVDIDKTYITNEKNGHIILRGIIVVDTEEKDGDNKVEEYDSIDKLNEKYHAWATARKRGHMVNYRATSDNWQDGITPNNRRRKRRNDDNFLKEVVGNETCDDDDNNVVYCNGPLFDDRKYSVKIVTCTEGGCVVTKYADTEYITDPLFPVAAVVVPLVLILVIVGLLGGGYWMYRNDMLSKLPIIGSGTGRESVPDLDNMNEVELQQKSRPVPVKIFGSHVEELHKDTNYQFATEYEILKEMSPVFSYDAAELPVNRTKNRYINIFPWDISRVKLLPSEDEEGSDYINANYMPGYNSKREFIASQGPLDSTINDFWRMIWETECHLMVMVTKLSEKGRGYNNKREFMAAQGPLPCVIDDFWRMVWEQRVPIIVMLTNIKERERAKCAKYWPDDQDPVFYGDIQVTLRSESVMGDYVIRVMDISHGENTRTVKQIHYIKWPDFGCPEKTGDLLNLVQVVRNEIRPDFGGPVCIHCSAGVGRTGTFISVDRLLQHMREHDEIDVFGTVLEMRHYRCHMVQTEDQYIYIHDCLKDAIDKGMHLGPSNNVYENFGATADENDEPLYANVSDNDSASDIEN